MVRTYTIGSISSGTMLPEDLIPAFVGELRYLAEKNRVKNGTLAFCRQVEKRMKQDGYFDTEEVGFDLEDLFDRLNEFAPPYFYFGANIGDGADYGFWLIEWIEDDFDGLKVDDLSEVPRSYVGEVLEVNNHGNMSLYYHKRGNFKEIWSLV